MLSVCLDAMYHYTATATTKRAGNAVVRLTRTSNVPPPDWTTIPHAGGLSYRKGAQGSTLNWDTKQLQTTQGAETDHSMLITHIIMIILCLLVWSWYVYYSSYDDHIMHTIMVLLRLLCVLVWSYGAYYAYYSDHILHIIMNILCLWLW